MNQTSGPPGLPLDALLSLHDEARADAVLYIARRPRAKRPLALLPGQAPDLARRQGGGWWVTINPAEQQYGLSPSPAVADSPSALHPLFIAAVLTSRQLQAGELSAPTLGRTLIPAVDFDTPEDIRRSMTLNGMRMTTELVQHGSQRVLELIANRLQLGQTDVVHDVIVYVMRQLGDLREEECEARFVRADSVAAWLGLDAALTRDLFSAERLSPERIAAAVSAGRAGEPRRRLDVPQLIEDQLRLLRPELNALRERERLLLWLLDEMVGALTGDRSGPESKAGVVNCHVHETS